MKENVEITEMTIEAVEVAIESPMDKSSAIYKIIKTLADEYADGVEERISVSIDSDGVMVCLDGHPLWDMLKKDCGFSLKDMALELLHYRGIVMKDIEVQIKDLGDVSGHTLWVTLPKHTSTEQAAQFRDQINAAMPADTMVIVATEEVSVEKVQQLKDVLAPQ